MPLQVVEEPIGDVTEEEYKKIDGFLTKKRKDIIFELYEHKRVSHGELALLISSTPTSLTNIIIKMEKFEYPLILSETEGKYRFYSLSRFAEAYITRYKQEGSYQPAPHVISVHDKGRLLQKTKECLKQFRNMYDEDTWEVRLDDVFLKLISHSEKDLIYSESIINQFILNIELMIMQEYDNELIKIIKYLDSPILRQRLEEYLQGFYAFCPLIRELEDDNKIFDIYDKLHCVITEGRKEKVEEKREDGKMDLFDIIEKIKEDSVQNNLSKRYIYQCLNRYLLGNASAAAFIAGEIWNELERGKQFM